MLCEYGCGREAIYYFPTVKKGCCSSHFSKCPEKRKKFSGKNNPMFKKDAWNKGKTQIYSQETLEKIRKARKTKGKTYEEIYGEEKAIELKSKRKKHFSEIRKGKDPWNKNKKGVYSKDSIKKMRKSSTYNIDDYKRKHKEFYNIEKPRINNEGKLEVRCKECNNWFQPTRIQITERIRCLKTKYKNSNSFLFCSNECSNQSEYFNRKVNPVELSKFKKYSSMVHKLTRKTVKEYGNKIPNLVLRGNKHGYELDHKFSIYDGFKNNILPEIISRYNNLQIIPTKENRSKKSNSVISYQELIGGLKC